MDSGKNLRHYWSEKHFFQIDVIRPGFPCRCPHGFVQIWFYSISHSWPISVVILTGNFNFVLRDSHKQYWVMAHLSQKIHPVQDCTMFSSTLSWTVTDFPFAAELRALKERKQAKYISLWTNVIRVWQYLWPRVSLSSLCTTCTNLFFFFFFLRKAHKQHKEKYSLLVQ